MHKAQVVEHAEEKAEVEVLKGQVSKYEEISKKLRSLQSRLQGDGRSITDSLGPIKDESRNNQIVTSNIEQLVTHIDKMLVSGQDKGREEQIIRRGPAQVGLEEYVGCVRRLDRALEQLKTANMRAQQQTIGDYNELLSAGLSQLQDLFSSMISDESAPIEPLNYITKMKPFKTFSQETYSDLRAMERCLGTSNARHLSYNQRENVAVRVFSEIRSAHLYSSLQSLALACISMSKRKNSNEPYRQGDGGVGPYCTALEGMFLAEVQNVTEVFAHDEVGFVLEATCRKTLSELSRTMRELNVQIKANIGADCFLAYDILDTVTTVGQRLGQQAPDLKIAFIDSIRPIRETAKASLPELLDEQRHTINTLHSLPADSAALSFTTETMKRLQMMTAYVKPLSSILTSLGDGGWTSSGANSSNRSLDVGADGTALFGNYVMDTMDAHYSAIEYRSRLIHKSKAHTGVLLYNTVAVIMRMIRSSDISSILQNNQSAQIKMENWRKKAVSTYMDAWKEPSAALLDVIYTNRQANRPPSGASLPSADVVKGLSSKDKDAIKEKFKHFNASFDESVRRHKEMMPAMEREVRNGLAREINNMIEPLYARFFDKYEAMDRGRGKYVRYDKGSLSVVLAGLG